MAPFHSAISSSKICLFLYAQTIDFTPFSCPAMVKVAPRPQPQGADLCNVQLSKCVFTPHRNSSSTFVDHTPFLAKLAVHIWRASPDSLSSLWTGFLVSRNITSIITLDPEEFETFALCGLYVREMPTPVQRSLVALAFLVHDTLQQFSIGDMLTAGMHIE